MTLHIETPLIESRPLSLAAGRSVWLKLDALQPCGSFKLRGVGHACEVHHARGARHGGVPGVHVPAGVRAEHGRRGVVDEERQVGGDARAVRRQPALLRHVVAHEHEARRDAARAAAARHVVHDGHDVRLRLRRVVVSGRVD